MSQFWSINSGTSKDAPPLACDHEWQASRQGNEPNKIPSWNFGWIALKQYCHEHPKSDAFKKPHESLYHLLSFTPKNTAIEQYHPRYQTSHPNHPKSAKRLHEVVVGFFELWGRHWVPGAASYGFSLHVFRWSAATTKHPIAVILCKNNPQFRDACWTLLISIRQIPNAMVSGISS